MKHQALIKTIPVTEVTEGMHVIWRDKIYTVYRKEEYGFCRLQQDEFKFPSHLIPILELKTIVAEYWVSKHIPSFNGGVHTLPPKRIQVRLKDSDLQMAIDGRLIDSGEVVDCVIIKDCMSQSEEETASHCGSGCGCPDLATIIPKEKRIYTEQELEDIAMCWGIYVQDESFPEGPWRITFWKWLKEKNGDFTIK